MLLDSVIKTIFEEGSFCEFLIPGEGRLNPAVWMRSFLIKIMKVPVCCK
jgi:hypothetical protein